ncbi:hypothetical protein HPC49_23710 [Pyxidicoccus fallax]|uniref:Lipoprotein n=1 Tax=Pyxidicoccus fallax TaxID=394095 RepID=A0A848LGK4_9BACT|nr:hypothetical protein [Pyxidicoccus fallax]NMO16713.1 hypothetical protein [Pyxidicoccus fallax]NPC81222.1 hypothetical protein [Pyxidicoccus fallax]
MRKLMMAVTAVAGLALVSGCKQNNVESERRDVAEAQQEAQRETAEATQSAREETASAQQNAQEDIASAQRNAQEDIASAQQDVREEEKDLAEAQRGQQEELAENQREQQEELREDSAQGGSGTAGAAAAATSVNGRVLSTGGDSLTVVDTTSNKQLKLKTNDQTRIMQNNAPVKLDDLTEGSQVRASYVMEGKDMVVRELTVTQPAQKKQ